MYSSSETLPSNISFKLHVMRKLGVPLSTVLQEKVTVAIVVAGFVWELTAGLFYKGTKFVLPHGWKTKTLQKYCSSDFMR